MTRDEWLCALAAELGTVPPTTAEADALLALAGDAAHASERTAAPLSCWLAARAGVEPAAAAELGRRLASSPPPSGRLEPRMPLEGTPG